MPQSASIPTPPILTDIAADTFFSTWPTWLAHTIISLAVCYLLVILIELIHNHR